jgi:hypothetical protein
MFAVYLYPSRYWVLFFLSFFFFSFEALSFFFKNRAPMMSKREDIIYLDVVPISEALQL